MWLFTRHGFYSLTRSTEEPDKLQVRARVRRDLENLQTLTALTGPILETPSADYRWRWIVTPTETAADRSHINWVVLDSDWEAEFCRVAESHPRVRAYVKNHNLGLEVPYRYQSETRKYLPDFIVLIDDGRPPLADGSPDLLHLIVEIKGYRREDAKEKKSTMETYWIPGVNNSARLGRWSFAEFTDIYARAF